VNILGVSGAWYWDANVDSVVSVNEISKWVHGAGLTLIVDGKLIFSISNERFTRIKYDGNFSKSIAIDILSKFNFTPKDIDIVVMPDYCHETPNLNLPRPHNYISAEVFFKDIFINAEIHIVDHHLAHSMGSFLTSTFKDEDVNIYSFDTTGSSKILYNAWAENWSSLSIGNYKNKQFINLHAPYTISSTAPLYGGGVGGFYMNYSGFTLSRKNNLNWKNIKSNSWEAEAMPGKVMGLAAYGNAIDFPSPMMLHSPTTNEYEIPNIIPNNEYTESHYVEIAPHMLSDPNIPNILNQQSKFLGEDIAAWTQQCFEKIMLEYFSKLPKQVKKKKLCLGGGCALNILLNSKLIEEGLFEDVHIPPAPNDDGLHQGAALLKAWQLEKEIILPSNIGCIGLEYSDADIKNAITDKQYLKNFNKNFSVKTLNFQEVINYTVTKLKNNNIIGWYQGRSEFGPRALGNRSILANPCYDNKQHLNTKVKKREEWRPYAAVVLEEYVDDWFDTPKKDSYYMLFSAKVKSDKLGLIPAVTHVDNSCRIQVVNREQNQKLYLLLRKFYELTGVPILLNTSFNTIPKEPIVETPGDAINSFMYSKMDAVVLHNNIIERQNISNEINIEYT
jgi:carbamoyltransferase